MRLPFLRAKVSPDEPAPRVPRGGGAADGNDNTVQLARTRARRRLVGALVLLTAGVLGFPVLFETQPRPLPVDTPIIVPAGTSSSLAGQTGYAPAARPPPMLPPDAGSETVAAVAPAAAPAPPPAAAPEAKAAAVPAKTTEQPAAEPAAKAAVKPVVKEAVKEAAKAPASAAAPGAGASPAVEPGAGGRFVVQVGAYNEVERLRAARQKLEKMGYKTYTQDVQTPSGKRTRLRVGPFGGRPDAEAVAAKVKASGMQAVVLTL